MLNDLLAAFTLYTRLPVGVLLRGRAIPADSFSRSVGWWPVVGLATGAFTGAVLWWASLVLPMMAAAVVAFGARAVLTGAFHEDGLGDFFDGMGGGRTRERTLEIMKDSRTGSYGVVGTVLYFLLVVSLVSGLSREMAALVVGVGDPLSKFIAARLVDILPYARPAEDAKTGAVYRRTGLVAGVVSAAAGVVPMVLLLPHEMWLAATAPVAMLGVLAWMMWRRLGGYTGDCCGATFLLCEAAFYIGIWVALSWA
jgi:adenosylcobinamide-GDP ribazoletransferase